MCVFESNLDIDSQLCVHLTSLPARLNKQAGFFAVIQPNF